MKRIETRSWATRHRGLLAIHAGAGFGPGGRGGFERWLIHEADEYMWGAMERLRTCGWDRQGPWADLSRLPRSAIVAVCRLADCVPVERLTRRERARQEAFCDFSPGRYAWRLEAITMMLPPVPCTGAQGLWRVPDDVALRLTAAQRFKVPA